MAPIDITGVKFGRLTPLSVSHSDSLGRHWRCDCDCGGRIIVPVKRLRNGNTQSCGCISRERVSAMNVERSTHGMTDTETFTCWVNMIQRCTNSEHKSYKRYGGRGVTVCERWLNSFEAFLEDMGERPFSGAQIDRRNNDGNYEPSNCRWVTPEFNMNNRSNSRIVEHQGRSLSVAQWSREIGCSRQALRHRLNSGWSIEEALTTPFIHGRNKK